MCVWCAVKNGYGGWAPQELGRSAQVSTKVNGETREKLKQSAKRIVIVPG